MSSIIFQKVDGQQFIQFAEDAFKKIMLGEASSKRRANGRANIETAILENIEDVDALMDERIENQKWLEQIDEEYPMSEGIEWDRK